MSKFKGILDARKDAAPELATTDRTPDPPAAPAAGARPRGRPRGKRSNPDFEPVTAYIRRDTHTAVKLALLQDGRGQEFSELVEELLSQWLTSRS